MTDLFISTLESPLKSWKQAFSSMAMVAEPSALTAYELQQDDNIPMVWIHLQEQTQHWLKGTIEGVHKHLPKSRIAVLASVPNPNEALFAIGLGAGAYVHAYTSEHTLVEIKKAILHGGVWLGSDLLKRLIEASVQQVHFDQQAPREDLLEMLTPREQEVAIEAAKGFSNKEIARNLNITERTVKAHLTSVFESLNVKDRMHLALILRGQNRATSAEVMLQKKLRPPPPTLRFFS